MLAKKRKTVQFQLDSAVAQPKRAKTEFKVKDDHGQASHRPSGKLKDIRDLIPQGMNISRKALRKEIRQMKKSRRHAYFSKQEMPTLAGKLSDQHKQYMAKQEAAKKLKEKEDKQREKNAAKRLAREARKNAYERAEKLKLEKEEEEKRIIFEENREIKQLEKQLHMNKKKSKQLPAKFMEEGLDYILDSIDPDKINETMGRDDDKEVWTRNDVDSDEDSGGEEDGDSDESSGEDLTGELGEEEEEEDEESESDDEGLESKDEALESDGEELESKDTESMDENEPHGKKHTGRRAVSIESEEEDIGDEEDVECGEEGDGGDEAEFESGDDFGLQGDGDSGSEDAVSGNAYSDSENSETSNKEEIVSDKNNQTVKEDIYGRLRDNEGNVVKSQVYLTPARRREILDSSSAEVRSQKQIRLKKQLKGELNRLSDANMVSITNHIEAMYREQSRADMTSCLRDLVSELALSDILTPERLSMELAMLIAVLHNNIGTEIGANFLEALTELFSKLHADHSQDNESKKIHNVASFLCHLYSFQVTHAVLITDILYKLIESFRDRDIELILIMLKSIGFTLRKDDSSVLKDIILKTQQQANNANIDTYEDKSRVKFMLEIVLAIKNNNMRKIPNYDVTHMEHLKKLLRGYVKGGSVSGGQLRITYKDLLEAKDKGKWWVVGSAWQGSQTLSNEAGDVTQVSQSKVKHKERFSEKLLKLARQQRMNTETRRLIFCTIMSSEDFVDAFEKLLKLGLKTTQEREIITVILECCSNELQYNAYYTYLMGKFITYDRRFLFTFQVTMWDKFKILSSLSNSSIENLAQLSAKLIVDQTIPLSILKNIEFGELTKSMVRYLKSLLVGVFSVDKKLIMEIFYKVGAAGNKLKHLKEGLELFMNHFILRKCKEPEKASMEKCITAAENGLSLNKDAAMF